jgi:hypothetical protein
MAEFKNKTSSFKQVTAKKHRPSFFWHLNCFYFETEMNNEQDRFFVVEGFMKTLEKVSRRWPRHGVFM